MLHYEQVFGNVFERRESKCCAVLMKHCRKVKGEQVITLQMAQQLKTKNINIVLGQLFFCQCKAKFFLRDRLTVLMIKINFNLLQMLTVDSLNVTKEKASNNWHLTCHLTRIYEKFKVQYFRSIRSTS